MAQQVLETPVDAAALVEHLVTEDDTLVTISSLQNSSVS